MFRIILKSSLRPACAAQRPVGLTWMNRPAIHTKSTQPDCASTRTACLTQTARFHTFGRAGTTSESATSKMDVSVAAASAATEVADATLKVAITATKNFAAVLDANDFSVDGSRRFGLVAGSALTAVNLVKVTDDIAVKYITSAFKIVTGIEDSKGITSIDDVKSILKKTNGPHQKQLLEIIGKQEAASKKIDEMLDLLGKY